MLLSLPNAGKKLTRQRSIPSCHSKKERNTMLINERMSEYLNAVCYELECYSPSSPSGDITKNLECYSIIRKTSETTRLNEKMFEDIMERIESEERFINLRKSLEDKIEFLF